LRYLVTGGCGFIGSNFIRALLSSQEDVEVVNLDMLTYAGNPQNLLELQDDSRYRFVNGDICDPQAVETAMEGVDIVVHFAAESHVDRSIHDGSVFVRTNVLGTNTLLQCAVSRRLDKFIHISTDEVYGSATEGSFKEGDPLNPSSPYSSSKAGSDLLALSYYNTYGLPVLVTRCTNNYGPYQHPEKLVPRFITNLLDGKKLPVYGSGSNVRDWIHVEDHCSAVRFLVHKGRPGEIYNIGSGNELTNMDVTRRIILALGKGEESIEHVEDRKGHDFRYSLDSSKLRSMGWNPERSFDSGLLETVEWYKTHRGWWEPLIH
jgi:dTDP-glucose 4,6-dehydratase